MEETIERPGFFGRIRDLFNREDDLADGHDTDHVPTRPALRVHHTHRFHVCVRRQVVSFQDAVAAADGLKRGELQSLNLTMCPPELREKIKDFMCGVGYNAEGEWIELGDSVYLLVPPSASVEIANASQRMVSNRN